MFLLLLLILPIWFVGFKLTRVISSEKRLEVIVPVSLFGSINLFILTLNLLSYIFRPPLSVYITYLSFLSLGITLLRLKKLILTKIDIPKLKTRKLLFLSIFIWALLLFQIIGHMGLSGDPTLYATIAKSYTRGNFPILAPWQPDIKLAYHYGPSIFLGSFHVLTDSSFDLIQRSTAYLIVLMLAIFLIWILKRHLTLKSLIIYQLIPLIILISLGNWMIAIPKFPLEFPQNFTGILDYVSKLPTVDMAFSTYGGSIISLTGLIFFYHELIGVVSFIWIVWLSFTYTKDQRIKAWIILTLSLASLSVINEVLLPFSLIASNLIILSREFPFKTLLSIKNIFSIFFLISVFTTLVAFQGGVITEALFGKKPENPTLQFFPDKKQVFVHNALYDNYHNVIHLENTDLQTYQLQQQSSQLFLPTKEKWLPFIWFHPGFIFFYVINFIICLLLLMLKQKTKLLICLSFLLPAICATLIYNSTFVLANISSRLLGFSYSFLGVNIVFFLIWTLEYLVKNKKLQFIILVLVMWLTIPSFFPTLAIFLNRGEKNNKLIVVDHMTVNPTEEWIYKNLSYNTRLLFLSAISPSSFTNIGIFMPISLGKYRDFSMDNSPEYYDLIITLNPTALKKFKITHILLDSASYSKLPKIRRDQLNSSEYFSTLFSTSHDLASENGEKLYQINNKYLNEVSDLPGTFKELDQSIIPKKSKVYIDTSSIGVEDKAKWSGLKRALQLALKDRDLFFIDALPGYNNTFYTHMEAKISGSEPSKNTAYDYLALSYATDPKTVCDCKTEIIWKGFDNFIFIWKVFK